jgi:hypothetical protein
LLVHELLTHADADEPRFTSAAAAFETPVCSRQALVAGGCPRPKLFVMCVQNEVNVSMGMVYAASVASRTPPSMDVKLFSKSKCGTASRCCRIGAALAICPYRSACRRRSLRPAMTDVGHSFTMERFVAILDAFSPMSRFLTQS